MEAGSLIFDKCSIGIALNEDCHKKLYCRTNGLQQTADLPLEVQKLLEWRSGVHLSAGKTLCNHHEKVFITRYKSLQKHCIDPFKVHKSQITKALTEVDEKIAKHLGLKPGQKLCANCHKKFKEQFHEQKGESSPGEDFEPPETVVDALNSSSSFLGCSPMKPVSNRDKPGYGKRKLRDLNSATKAKLAKALEVSTDELDQSDAEVDCQKCEDLGKFINEIKVKVHEAGSISEKLTLLTLVPVSWTIQKIQDEFRVSQHIARKARELKKNKGLLGKPDEKRGRPLNPDVVGRIKEYYQSDEHSGLCPGKKEYVSVKVDGKRVQMQKRLLLLNLKELHLEYQKSTGDKVSFSKFCELRPKWCVSVNSRGMHSVCVCEQHQNAKLLIAAVPDTKDYKEYFTEMVCSTENRKCMMQLCENCPGRKAFEEHLVEIFQKNDISMDESITYKQWLHTDRTTLVDLQITVDEFITIVSNKFDSLRKHHFTAKAQSSYLKLQKDILPDDTAIVLLDFAENYSFLVQDAVQGFHWDNSQATLHPFAVYYREQQELKCMSVCMISDCMTHDTTSVHAFITQLVSHLKDKPHITKLIYFSDGAASQYKNYKNFSNLCHHKGDHEINAEWHFFATSHGKSPCDGIGGTVKRLVARASLQATEEGQILTPQQMYSWAVKNIDGVRFFYLSDEDVKTNAEAHNLEERYRASKTVSGTRSHHSFVPISENAMQMRRLSGDDLLTTVSLGDNSSHIAVSARQSNQYQPGKYVACMYDHDWYIGNIVERSEDNSDVYVKFMKRSQNNTLSWPQGLQDECWVPFQDVLCIIDAPEAQGRGGRHYSLSPATIEQIISLVQNLS